MEYNLSRMNHTSTTESGANLAQKQTPFSLDPPSHIFLGKSAHTEALKLGTDGLENGAFRMASGVDWLALLGPDEDYAPIEPWGRMRSVEEAARVKGWMWITPSPWVWTPTGSVWLSGTFGRNLSQM